MKDEEIKAAAGKGVPVHVPTVLGAVTVSYNVNGVEKGLKLDGATIADIFLGKITKWNDPAIASLNSGASLPGTDDHGLPPLRRVRHHEELHGVPQRLLDARGRAAPASDKTVKWPTGTGAKGNDGVAALRQADRRRRRLRRAGVRAAEQLHLRVGEEQVGQLRRADARRRRRRPVEGVQVPADLRFSTDQRARADRLPDHGDDVPARLRRTCARPASRRRTRSSSRTGCDYALGDGQSVAQGAPVRAAARNIKSKAQAKVDGLQCNGGGAERADADVDGGRQHDRRREHRRRPAS